jgi:chromosome segregation ATPase
VAVGCDPSTIRIEEEADEYQIMKNEYMETELLMSKMATDTRNDIHELREQIKGEQKNIKEMEKVLTSKRARLTTLQEKLASSTQALEKTPLEDYEQFINSLQEEYDTIDAIGEREITSARQECSELEEEGAQLDASMQVLEAEIDRLGNFNAERYNCTLAELLEEEEQLNTDIAAMEREGEEIGRCLREREAERPIKE